MRFIEAFILSLITVMAACFCVEIFLAKPNASQVLLGVVPHISRKTLYISIAMLGATVMPHNLYLHSALVQTRQIGHTDAGKRAACRYNLADSVVALNAALLVNAAILILSAAVFFRRGIVVTEIQQAHLLLVPLLGTAAAGILFAVALLCSGQSSTLTGTLAGQIVMEGFLNIRMRPWLRRLITRTIAIIPARFVTHLHFRRVIRGHLSVADPEPGRPQHAVAFRRHPFDPFHQRPAAHGHLRQQGLGQGDLRGRSPC